MNNKDLFKYICKYMKMLGLPLADASFEIGELGGNNLLFYDYIDGRYPELRKYITLDNNDLKVVSKGLVKYMEHIAKNANKPYLDVYLVANYVDDERPQFAEECCEEWGKDLAELSVIDENIDINLPEGLITPDYMSDEELDEMYDELECFAKGIVKPKVTNVKVSNGIGDLFDKTVKGNNAELDIVTLKDRRSRRELDRKPIKKINTERYAKSIVEFIKSLLKRASELNRIDGYILARDFDDYNLGRLKYGDSTNYYEEYSDEDESYLISSRDFDDKELEDDPSFDSADCFSIDGDVLTIRLNFSSDDASNDRSESFVEGGIPEYKDLDFDYLKSLLWNEGIVIEKEDNRVSDDGGWTHRNTNVLTIRYYRNEKDLENLSK